MCFDGGLCFVFKFSNLLGALVALVVVFWSLCGELGTDLVLKLFCCVKTFNSRWKFGVSILLRDNFTDELDFLLEFCDGVKVVVLWFELTVVSEGFNIVFLMCGELNVEPALLVFLVFDIFFTDWRGADIALFDFSGVVGCGLATFNCGVCFNFFELFVEFKDAVGMVVLPFELDVFTPSNNVSNVILGEEFDS